MASWHVTGYYKCYHCMPDYFEFVNLFLNQGHRALLGDGPLIFVTGTLFVVSRLYYMVHYMSSYLGICLKLSGTQGPTGFN